MTLRGTPVERTLEALLKFFNKIFFEKIAKNNHISLNLDISRKADLRGGILCKGKLLNWVSLEIGLRISSSLRR